MKAEAEKMKDVLSRIENKKERTREDLQEYFLSCQKRHIIISGQAMNILSKIPTFPLEDFKEWVFERKFDINGGQVAEYLNHVIGTNWRGK